jgi:S1-C subfamily serine protease
MLNYNLPEFKKPEIKEFKNFLNSKENKPFQVFIFTILVASLCGFLAGLIPGIYFYSKSMNSSAALGNQNNFLDVASGTEKEIYIPKVNTQEEEVINAVKKVSPAVVSIIVSKDVPIMEQYYYSPFDDFFGTPFFEFSIPQYRQKGFEKRDVGGGTGFIISEDGMILTNKHVVLDEEAEYTVLTLDGKKFKAGVLAKDPAQDIAILKIGQEEVVTESGEIKLKPFPKVELGNSDGIQIGQTAIAIGYVLGKYQNAISLGVISGLGRTITASGGDFYETLEDIVQTDAAINKGNSGGPLLNLGGKAIGINTAIDVEGQNIGFAIPINKAKRDIEQVKSSGKITYPFLGIRYVIIDKSIQSENSLSVDYGAWIIKGQGEPAVVSGSSAEKAGLRENDIILEFNGEKITAENSLAKIVVKYSPGDSVSLKILRGEAELFLNAVLGETSS